jgi:hypothetical protein
VRACACVRVRASVRPCVRACTRRLTCSLLPNANIVESRRGGMHLHIGEAMDGRIVRVCECR